MTPQGDRPAPRRRRAAPEEPAGEPLPRPRTGARSTVKSAIALLPKYLKLLFGLMTDRRVASLDKLLVAGAIAYILMPLDFLPDFIPFLGQVDDVFLLMTSLQRLIWNSGRAVLMRHWTGTRAELSDANLHAAVMAAAFFLPRRMRRRVRPLGRF